MPDTLVAPPEAAAVNPYLPKPARLVSVRRMVPDNDLFTFRFVDSGDIEAFRHRPGQFVMLSLAGVGEAPISISSSPSRPGVLEFCVRRVGRLTGALYQLAPNAVVGIRGPYGNGFPIDRIEGHDLLIAAGGLGMAPLRSLLWWTLDHRDRYGRVTLMYGARQPDTMLFRDELVSLTGRSDLDCLLTVDEDPGGEWSGHIGLLPSLFDYARIEPSRTFAAVCGPPVVFHIILEKLLDLGFTKDRILMSLERRMKCGVGKCGHCSVGYRYTCVHGPIFTYWDAINLPELV